MKQYKMMKTVILIYERALKLIQKAIPLSAINNTGIFAEYKEIKNTIKNEELEKIDEFDLKVKNKLKKLEEEYKEHINS